MVCVCVRKCSYGGQQYVFRCLDMMTVLKIIISEQDFNDYEVLQAGMPARTPQ